MRIPDWIQAALFWGGFLVRHLISLIPSKKGPTMDTNAILSGITSILAEVGPTLELVKALEVSGTDETRIAAIQPALKAVIDKLPLPAEVKAVAEIDQVLNIVCRVIVLGEDLAHAPVAEAPAVPQ